MDTQEQLHCVQMEIQGTVKKVPSGDRAEKEPAAVEKLLDIIKELVNDCMEERGE